ncbi:porin family protein [Abyssalbus ytuae]|uniref:PorT family protein n=1 Tax=Abyssalbus ytuae TaxID=2926907 RepID=A0A9E6ZN90_9FLAO|nr:porin family protein [Abyssalbus ytuae]UOB19034.1 PorT family protein [Abyssalbus ytuae]
MKLFLCIGFTFLVVFANCTYAQDEIFQDDEVKIIEAGKYLEDQFYIGVTYNILLNRPENVSQNNFSSGIQLGFIKDIPLNNNRNLGLGIGVGYATNSYFSNLRATKNSGDIVYDVIPSDVSYRRNKVGTHQLEIPFEFRWRTSTADRYKFWRLYSGIKLSYVFSARSKFITADDRVIFSNDEIEKFQYGLYFSFGYNTWNFYGYYQLNNLFSNDSFIESTGEKINAGVLSVGLMFYIL